MSEDKTIHILKSAILLEKRGQAFYSKIAQQTTGKAVKAFFELMADEEVKHVEILTEQFKAYRQNKKFNPGNYQENHGDSISTKVLTKELKEEMSAADYEAAAISAAMAMGKTRSSFIRTGHQMRRIQMKKRFTNGWPNGRCSI